MNDIVERVSLSVVPILKGVGKITGDGWKDTTKVDEIVFVWNELMKPPYKKGQYRRVDNEIWSASWDQYDFQPATVADVQQLFATTITDLRARLEAVPGWSESADGISCRDDTIALLDEKVAALRAEVEALRGALGRIVAIGDAPSTLKPGRYSPSEFALQSLAVLGSGLMLELPLARAALKGGDHA